MIKGITKIFEIIIDHAEKEYYSVPAIQKELMELDILYQDGDISEKEYMEIRDSLIERLLEARQMENEDQEED
ncbi:MAG: gas vesicle protein GvpG [Bacillota bacterium]|nr:gas vesicle protein GvpG [Bacillota bacterium]